MNLHAKLARRAADGNPIRVGMIGAGKFGSMFLAQARRTPGIHLVAVADLDVERARANLKKTGWDTARFGARTVAEAHKTGATCVTEDAIGMIGFDGLDIVIGVVGCRDHLCILVGQHALKEIVTFIAGRFFGRSAGLLVPSAIWALIDRDFPAVSLRQISYESSIAV